MFLKKVEHYLRSSFLLLLVFTQALIFVAVRANDDTNIINVSFASPISGQNISAGEQINLEAYLETKDQVDFSTVYFTVENQNINYSQNFEANYSSGGTWKASSFWDTTDLSSGYYLITVKAYDYNNGQLENYYSAPQVFAVEGTDYQMAAEISVNTTIVFASPARQQVVTENTLDISINSNVPVANVFFTIKEWDNQQQIAGQTVMPDIQADDLGGGNRWGISDLDISSLANSSYVILVAATRQSDIPPNDANPPNDLNAIVGDIIFSVNRAVEIVPLTATINSPTPNQTVKDNLLLKATLNRQLNSTNEQKVVAKINKVSAQGNSLVKQMDLATDNGALVYQRTINSADINNAGAPIYPDGNYNCEFIVLNGDNAQVASLGSANIFIDNVPDELTLSEQVVLNAPAIGSTIGEDSFIVDVSTLVPFAGVKIQFYKQDDAAISTDVIDVQMVDGYHWIYTLSLDNSFIDGNYILSLAFHDQNSDVIVGALDYNLSLSRQSDEAISDPSNIKIKLLNLDSNASGIESPVVLSSFEFSSGDIYLDVNKTTEDADINPVSLVRASWSTLASLGYYQGDYSETPYGYLASWDTKVLDNGNYKVVAKNNLNQNIVSEEKLVSIFNNQAEDNSEVLLKINDNFYYSSDGRSLVTYLMTNMEYTVRNLVYLENSKGEIVSEYVFQRQPDWSHVPWLKAEDYPETPYLYLYSLGISEDNRVFLEDGDYNVYAKIFSLDGKDVLAESNKVSFQVKDGKALGAEQIIKINEDELATNQNEVQENTQTSSGSSRIAIRLYDSCLDIGITSEENCLRFRAMSESLDKRCIDQSIFEASACEDYLNRTEVDLECQGAGIIDREQCKDYLLEQYGSNIDCRLADNNSCNDILRNYYLNRLVIAQKKQKNIDSVVEPLIGTTVNTQELGDKVGSFGLAEEALSMRPSVETKVFIAQSQKETILEDKDTLTVLGQAVMVFDTDGDTLPDDLENYYGTDINNPDTDGDSYSDGLEVQKGYNPLGEGSLGIERLDIEKILLEKQSLEQPKFKSAKTDEALDLKEVENLQGRVRLKGQALPNTWLAVYIYSDLPIVMLAKTDESGNWSYDIKSSLTDGHHQVYVTINDSTGKIVNQSRPVSFLVKSAQAVTANDYFDNTVTEDRVDSFLIYYIFAGVLLILVALSIIMFLHKNKKGTREA